MKPVVRAMAEWSAVVLMSAAGGAVWADVRENPYEVIVVRNAFNIHPAVIDTNPPAATAPVVPPAVVKLTGISTMGGQLKVILEITPTGKTPLKPPPLELNDRYEMVEVLAIDVEKGTAKVRTGTIETNLTFAVAGSEKTTALPGIGPPGVPISLVPPPAAGVQPVTATSSRGLGNRGGVMVAGGTPTTPTPTVPTPNVPSVKPQTTATPNTYGFSSGTAPSYRTIPPREIRTTTPTTTPTMTPEEAQVRMELLRDQYLRQAQQGIVKPPLPPTPLTPTFQGQQ